MRYGPLTLVVALLVGTIVAFALTEALKLSSIPVSASRIGGVFSPVCGCASKKARLAVLLRKDQTIDASLVDTNGDHVRTLARGLERDRGNVTFRWDGRDDAGSVVPDGAYRLRIRMHEEGRAVVLPDRIRVDATPPSLEVLAVRRRQLAPSGKSGVVIVFRTDELSRAVVEVEGEIAARGRFKPAGKRRLSWDGAIGASALSDGSYDGDLRVRDRAGNVASDRFSIRFEAAALVRRLAGRATAVAT